MLPSFSRERELSTQGYVVAGVDEVGRGAWAGPLVAAAVILPTKNIRTLARLKDSKQLLPNVRQQFCTAILHCALSWAIGVVTEEEIDTLGVTEANRLAMQRALKTLSVLPTYALLDAIPLPGLSFPTESIIRGDERVRSIAAASVIAKVMRDRMMVKLHEHDRRYRFDLHKGYGTALHQQRLLQHGPSPHHRKSFAPIRSMLE